MKKYWCFVLSLLLILVSFSACATAEVPDPSIEFTDPLAHYMASPEDYPQLTKAEFLEITDHYLSTGEWELPLEKACGHTSGINSSWYIIDNEYLFFLYEERHYSHDADGPNVSVSYDPRLLHYIDGVYAASETDPLLFAEFLK